MELLETTPKRGVIHWSKTKRCRVECVYPVYAAVSWYYFLGIFTFCQRKRHARLCVAAKIPKFQILQKMLQINNYAIL